MGSLRVGDSGDWHLTEGPRFADILAALDYVVDDGIAQGVNLWAFKGDFSGTTVPHVATVKEENALDTLFQRAATVAPVIIVRGNHDADGDLDGYARLDAPHPIYVIDKPTVLNLTLADGEVRLFVLPYPFKRDYLGATVSASIDGQDREIEGGLRGLLETWRPLVEEARAEGTPTLFLGHVTVGGCAIAGGEVMPPGQEIELAVADLQALGCDYSTVSHIHLCQELAPGLWYPGAPSRSNFGEVDPKGYLVVDVEPGQPPVVHRRLTPVRPFVTVTAKYARRDDGAWAWDLDGPEGASVAGAEVRLRVEVPEEVAATAPVADLEATFAEQAVAVQTERRVTPTVRVRCAEIAQAVTLPEKLQAFWQTLGESAPTAATQARALEFLAELMTRRAERRDAA